MSTAIDQAKRELVQELIQAELNGQDIKIDFKNALKYISYIEIAKYARESGHTYSFVDITKDQKVSLIKSIIKRTK